MINAFFESTPIDNPFNSYSLVHILVIIIFFIGIIVLHLFRNELNEKIVRWVFVSVILFFEIGYHTWLVSHGLWNPSHALPLQLCSVSLILCILLLLTNHKTIFEIVYFIGIAGAIQALLTPELFYNFPHLRFFHFFINHMLIIWTCLFYVWTMKYSIQLSSIFKSLVFLQIVAFIAFIANIVTGGNYMFLAGKPKTSSALDFLGDYPWYILSLEAIAVILFFILYLPFIKHSKRKK
ncbi:YwaF family protein [Ureibacillus manganicus]|uniref:YwaF family protein n=1 Tax=Ureibacillus manganicus TaxID=1266064 RepID=UPI0006920830|nr:TIGR02206 family membrane protein [Ureibacillus manganicus]